jgi:hypothetical protein
VSAAHVCQLSSHHTHDHEHETRSPSNKAAAIHNNGMDKARKEAR